MATSLRVFAFSLGCLLSWTIIMPLIVIGGGALLFVYAALAEISLLLIGNVHRLPDPATARKMARSICLGCEPPVLTPSRAR